MNRRAKKAALEGQRTNLEASEAAGKEWNNFFDSYISSADSYYKQVAFLTDKNSEITDTPNDGETKNNIIRKTFNYERIVDTNYVNEKEEEVEGETKTVVQMDKESLYTFNPVQEIVTSLNDSYGDDTAETPDGKPVYFNGQKYESDVATGKQSIQYVLAELPPITMTLSFDNPDKDSFYTFDVTITNLVARFIYLAYVNPEKANSEDDEKTFAHQWFFNGYWHYDLDQYADYYKDNENMKFNNGDANDWQIPGLSKDLKLAFGWNGADQFTRIEDETAIANDKTPGAFSLKIANTQTVI